jgi:hypothetical protein
MTDRPIIFSAPMVRALLDGRKTQTRRVLKPQAAGNAYRLAVYDPQRAAFFFDEGTGALQPVRLPYAPGDRLWVREAFRGDAGYNAYPPREWSHWPVSYEADPFETCIGLDTGRLRPSIHMPRWASRITLTVTDVRVQRLQEISEGDAIAEGCAPVMVREGRSSSGMAFSVWSWRDGYKDLWNSLHDPEAWGANPWVVALTFTVGQRNIDAGVAHD